MISKQVTVHNSISKQNTIIVLKCFVKKQIWWLNEHKLIENQSQGVTEKMG